MPSKSEEVGGGGGGHQCVIPLCSSVVVQVVGGVSDKIRDHAQLWNWVPKLRD